MGVSRDRAKSNENGINSWQPAVYIMHTCMFAKVRKILRQIIIDKLGHVKMGLK